MRRKIQLAAGLVMLAYVLGCASSRQYVHMPNLAVPIENNAMARIYVFRPSLVGSAGTTKVSVGAAGEYVVSDTDKVVGDMGVETFLCWEYPPGDIRITATDLSLLNLRLHIEAGHVYYILFKIGGVGDLCSLVQVDEQQGKKYLKACQPAPQK